MPDPTPASPDLRELASHYRVSTEYRNERREPVTVDAEVVRTVLGLLDVDAGDDAACRRELDRLQEVRRAGLLPPTISVRLTSEPVEVPGARGLVGEDGAEVEVDGSLPTDLAPGYYQLHAEGDQRCTLIAAPARVPAAPGTWGWMLQLYALRSARSWGIGDLGDLSDFVRWTADAHGAGAVLLNPLHAPGPTHPVQPSPYTPSSRRFGNPLMLRIEDLPAWQRADPAVRAEIDALRVSEATPRIDHDLVWAAKRAALELLWRAEGRPEPSTDGAPEGLADWAAYCALAERHGGRWTRWPAPLRDVTGAAVDAARRELAPRIAFHSWVQTQCSEQLAAVRRTATEAGMALGLVHDLPVGVDPDGADAWALAPVLAGGTSIGAPPDNFTPQGQNWGLPPWRPDRLAETGYAAYRSMLSAAFAHADGLRIDHVAGLWRLWWIPPGEGASGGTYVGYDAQTMLAVLAVEASRAKAVVIGEDLGTVEPEVTAGLAEAGMLGCAVGWFTRDEDEPGQPLLAPARWPRRAVASLSTHDLPTAAGFLSGAHVDVRADLGLLDDVPGERATAQRERREWLDLLRSEGFLVSSGEAGEGAAEDEGDPDVERIVLAMHRFLAATASQVKLVSPYDVIGETRQPNLPGTIDEYPNWRMPLPVTLEEFRADPRVAAVAEVFAEGGPAVEG